MDPLVLVALAVLAGIVFDLTNGWNDSANAIATVVSTRVLTPWRALFLSAGLNFIHGKNDAQKVMGVIALALFSGGFLKDEQGRMLTDVDQLYVPLWVKIVCATAMAVGTAVGGGRVIRTLGTRRVKISTVEGFSAETAAGVVLETAASLGVPVSTTRTITGGIIGVGAAKGARVVKWGIGAKILWAWVFTLPVCFVCGGVLSWLAARTGPLWMVTVVVAMTAAVYLGSLVRTAPGASNVIPGTAPR